jgi:hypothetical protein
MVTDRLVAVKLRLACTSTGVCAILDGVKRNDIPTEPTNPSDLRFEPVGGGRARFGLGDGTRGRVEFAALPATDRLVIVEVELTTTVERPIDTETWRRVPLGFLEQLANLPEHRRVLERKRRGTPVPFDLAQVLLPGTLADYELVARMEGGRYPDGFYDDVAAAYRRAVSRRKAPAQMIAEANDVPVTTVHRWIREARRRGSLAPSRGKGQAG